MREFGELVGFGVDILIDYVYNSIKINQQTGDKIMFTIEDWKFEAVMEIVETFDPKVLPETIREHILADWHEGDEHQEWLNEADAEEIADWVLVTAYQG